jgi:hypothetical protein
MDASTLFTTLCRLGLALGLAAGAAGCATTEPAHQAVEQTQASRTAAAHAPFRSITGFTPALRCMDNLFIEYGVRDVGMLVEDIFDQTRKVNAGTRDMLITALSDMTRRSRALRVIAFGRDATNVISFLASAQRHEPYEVVPQYGIKGSISQFDENVIRSQRDLGVGFQPFVNLGISRDAATSVLGIDLSVLSTNDLSILSGVTSRNSVVVLRTGRGADGDAAYHKFGVNFSLSLSKNEGQSQALRGLVELAAIELMGKLTKTPYWTCLGADAANDEIQAEIADWYYAMAADRAELIAYFQNQMRRRGFYQGPIDGEFNPAVDEAIANYRAALGLSRRALLDEPFFKAYLAAEHAKVARPTQPARHVAQVPNKPPPVLQPAPAADAAPPLALLMATTKGQTVFRPGEPIGLTVQPSRDAHVYCYLRDETARITRFFPNRFGKESLVRAAEPLALPGRMPFELAMQRAGADETIACFAAPKDISAQLPVGLFGKDFEPLAVQSLDAVHAAFASAAGATLAHQTLNVRTR